MLGLLAQRLAEIFLIQGLDERILMRLAYGLSCILPVQGIRPRVKDI